MKVGKGYSGELKLSFLKSKKCIMYVFNFDRLMAHLNNAKWCHGRFLIIIKN